MTLGLFIGGTTSYLGYALASYLPFIENHDLLDLLLAAIAFAMCGVVLGAALAFGRKKHLSLGKAVQGFGFGFLIAGVLYFIFDRTLSSYRVNRVLGWTQFLVIFAVAGALSAAFTRGRLFSVVNTLVSIVVGWTAVLILSSVLNEVLSNYLLTAFLIYCTLFSVITGALLKLQKSEAATNYQDVLQPQL
jgi:hypothetical protein